MKSIRGKKWTALFLFLIANVLLIVGIYWLSANREHLPLWVVPLVDGFGGNVVSGIIGSSLFLILAVYLDATTEERIERIHSATVKSEQILSQREKLLESDRLVREFEQFAKDQTYHDVRFPDLAANAESLGLEYTIEPVRDAATGEPVKYETEMETMYVVKVRGPAHESVLSPEELKRYEASPIRDNEFHFCRFFNDSWHMGNSVPMLQAHRFYFSGKVGPVYYGQSANSFVAAGKDPLQGKTAICTFYLRPDGTPLPAQGGGCDAYVVYKDESDGLYLRINDSQLKSLYYTNPADTWDDKNWFFVIEDMRGYAHGEKLKLVNDAVLEELARGGVSIRKVPWYNLARNSYEPPV